MLKPTTDFADCDNLIVTAYMNMAQAVSELQIAKNLDQTKESRAAAKARAIEELGCLSAHFQGALDLIPDE